MAVFNANPLNQARRRIAEEQQRNTGELDLRGLGLTAIPPELLEIEALRSLSINENDIADLAPLGAFRGLRTLECSRTRVSDLRPLGALRDLRDLDCSNTLVSDLAPLGALSGLRTLNCSVTLVSDLAPVVSHANLRELNCAGTRIADLAPVGSLRGLRDLCATHTPVSDLARVRFGGCRLEHLPVSLLQQPALCELYVPDCQIAGVPSRLLSQRAGDNCLKRLRDHFARLN